MRGKDSFPLLEALALGITPAYAGKSIGDALMGLELEDHPRLCGEKLLRTVRLHIAAGSPPPMRGKEDLCAKKLIEFRITPAYAGKRSVHRST